MIPVVDKPMKILWTLVCLALVGQVAMAGPEQIIKQRAKDVRDQNNVRQGVPAAPPRITSTPAAVAAMPPQSPLARLHSDVLTLKTNSPVTAAQIQQFARSLAAAAQGPNKPSDSSLQKLSTHLLTALAENPLSTNYRGRLLQNLMAILNAPTLTASQGKNIISDIQGILQMGGTPTEKAAAVAADIQAVSEQIRKS